MEFNVLAIAVAIEGKISFRIVPSQRHLREPQVGAQTVKVIGDNGAYKESSVPQLLQCLIKESGLGDQAGAIDISHFSVRFFRFIKHVKHGIVLGLENKTEVRLGYTVDPV